MKLRHDATGQKLTNTGSDGRWDYVNGVTYFNNAIKYITTEEGRATQNGGSYAYQYDLKDHLGDVRVTFDNNGTARVLQEDEYYAFGLRHSLYDNSNNNRHLYNGKEIQTDLANQYDYGARFYDPIIARWTSVDPKAEINRKWSPYVYGFNNFIRFIDPDGMWPDWSEIAQKSKSVALAAARQITTGTKGAIQVAATALTIFGDYGVASSSKNPQARDAAKQQFKKDVASTAVNVGVAVITGKLIGSLSKPTSIITNPVPSTLARVVPTEFVSGNLGKAGVPDVFVTAAADIKGMNAAQIAERLTIQPSSSGFTVYEFPTPQGVSTPINRIDPGFVGGGRTAGGAREFTIPNQPIPKNATTRTIEP